VVDEPFSVDIEKILKYQFNSPRIKKEGVHPVVFYDTGSIQAVAMRIEAERSELINKNSYWQVKLLDVSNDTKGRRTTVHRKWPVSVKSLNIRIMKGDQKGHNYSKNIVAARTQVGSARDRIENVDVKRILHDIRTNKSYK